jgi:hypothetical protein
MVDALDQYDIETDEKERLHKSIELFVDILSGFCLLGEKA